MSPYNAKNFLLLLVFQSLDEFLGQHIALFEERVFLCELFLHGLGFQLAVTHRCESIGGNAVLNEIVDHRFGPSLRESLVVSLRSLVVGVGAELNGDIGVLVEQRNQLVERRLGTVAQSGLVEIVKDVVDECGG